MTKALMVIDVQRWGFTGNWQVADSEGLLARIQQRVDEARANGEFIVHVQNDGAEGEADAPGGEFWPVMIEPEGDEWLVNKTTSNTFETNPDLAGRLRAAGIDELELVGCQSEMCVRSTALGARAEGFAVTLPVGLHGTYDEETFTGKPGKTAVEFIAEVQAEIDPR